jgi:branched-chain amino acid aminotransferase
MATCIRRSISHITPLYRRVPYLASRPLSTPLRCACPALLSSAYRLLSSGASSPSNKAKADPRPVGEPDTSLPNLSFSSLTVERTTRPKQKLPKEQLKFGQLMSDHMLTVDWSHDKGWASPAIIPYQPLQLDPAASSLHYALQCFEGMKAYIDDNDNIRMFRPDRNMQRLNSSAHRLLMPAFDGGELIKCIQELLRVDRDWIPRGFGYSLYIRPTLISTHPYLGVSPSTSCKLYVITSPVGPYYPEGFAAVKLFADPHHARAWPGGTGNAKIGGNYAMGIRPAHEAALMGYSQILWLYGEDHQVTEVGTMNIFFLVRNATSGRQELLTAPLDGTILPGVTRDSILSLTREWGELEVSERHYTVHDLIRAVEEGRMVEAFGAGTAAIVAPVKAFAFQGKEYPVPLSGRDGKAGKLTERLSETLMGIQYGRIPHPWSVIVAEK